MACRENNADSLDNSRGLCCNGGHTADHPRADDHLHHLEDYVNELLPAVRLVRQSTLNMDIFDRQEAIKRTADALLLRRSETTAMAWSTALGNRLSSFWSKPGCRAHTASHSSPGSPAMEVPDHVTSLQEIDSSSCVRAPASSDGATSCEFSDHGFHIFGHGGGSSASPASSDDQSSMVGSTGDQLLQQDFEGLNYVQSDVSLPAWGVALQDLQHHASPGRRDADSAAVSELLPAWRTGADVHQGLPGRGSEAAVAFHGLLDDHAAVLPEGNQDTAGLQGICSRGKAAVQEVQPDADVSCGEGDAEAAVMEAEVAMGGGGSRRAQACRKVQDGGDDVARTGAVGAGLRWQQELTWLDSAYVATKGELPADVDAEVGGETEKTSYGCRNDVREMMYSVAAFQPIDWRSIMAEVAGKERPRRRNVRISKEPQSVAARRRRECISDRIRILQRLVPGTSKLDTASMLDEAIHYLKFLKLQVQALRRVDKLFFTAPAMALVPPFEWPQTPYPYHHSTSALSNSSHPSPLQI